MLAPSFYLKITSPYFHWFWHIFCYCLTLSFSLCLLYRLEGKVAIVTGGSRGIGEAIVRLFVQHGARVIVADIDDSAGEALAASLGPHASFMHCDVSEESDIERVVARAISCHGKLDILCNNAGVLGRQTRVAKSIMSFDADEFDRVMRINVRGSALGIKHAARVMVPSGTGCVISIASVAGVLGGLGPHAYTASKHAVVGITRYELLVFFFISPLLFLSFMPFYFCPLNLHI